MPRTKIKDDERRFREALQAGDAPSTAVIAARLKLTPRRARHLERLLSLPRTPHSVLESARAMEQRFSQTPAPATSDSPSAASPAASVPRETPASK